jgi:hypothetical protein
MQSGLALALAVGASAVAAAATWSADRAIFTAEAARTKWSCLFRAGATPWTPAAGDVDALEQRLPDHLRAALPRQRPARGGKAPLWERATAYKRQYVGVRRDGRRIVHANFFCDAWKKDWRTEPIVVLDGGDCYFQIEYDVDKASFSNLQINGEA